MDKFMLPSEIASRGVRQFGKVINSVGTILD